MLKYGLLSHKNEALQFSNSKQKEEVNLGDYVQSIGVHVAYDAVGVPAEQIEWVEKYAICGEKNFFRKEDNTYIVTLNNVYSGGGHNEVLHPFPTARNVIPLFIGFNCLDENIIAENIDFFKKWEPIGCRDEKTKELVKKYEINCFLSGCSSILLPERKTDKNQQTVFFVDIPDSLHPYIPPEYLKNAKFVSQNILKSKFEYVEDDTYYKETIEYLSMYEKEAMLVVTSKLHCAIPCLAMGIPVILAVENIDYRFAWVEKLLPIYTNWETIEWECIKRDISHAKELLLNVYRNRISVLENGFAYKNESINKIDFFYMCRVRNQYNMQKKKQVERIVKGLKKRRKKSKLKVLIWGAGRTGGFLFDLLNNEFVEVEIQAFIDSYRKGYYKNKFICGPEDINKYEFDFIFLCTVPGKVTAIKKMNELSLIEKVNYEEVFFESVFCRNAE